MHIVRTQSDLEALCADFADAPYLAVDTEFMRERTYWPVLCLVQIARPARGGDAVDAAIIDPIDTGLDLAPLIALMDNPNIVKVFHAARQDLEIFVKIGGKVPTPIFDTQVAAAVCGYGDQVGYEPLTRKIVGEELDKSARFTDWSSRPLSQKQLAYALGDVTHLRVIYESLRDQLAQSGRDGWLAEDMAVLTDPATYENDPEQAWRRLRMRRGNGRFMACAAALAQWRETEAQRRNSPRNRVIKDDALMELAASRPKTPEELQACRLASREIRGDAVGAVLAVIAGAGKTPPEGMMQAQAASEKPSAEASSLSELLRVLLKACAADAGVAPRMIASSSELDRLAVEDAPEGLMALEGWRREVFGEKALRLRRGEVALSASPSGVRVVEVAQPPAD